MRRILVIDDEKNIRKTIKSTLTNDEQEVDLAMNGEEGLEKLENQKYDLALLDINMPGITGIELLRKVREKGIDTSIIIISAYGTVEKAVDAMKLGAIDFLSKPFSPTQIRELVNQVIDRKSLAEDEIESYEDLVEYAKACILNEEYEKAEEFLQKATAMEVNAGDPHNLLGVLMEMKGQIQQAQKHYRAALALEPTHQAANKNLQRTGQFVYSNLDIDLG